MKICLGSKNPVKLQALQETFSDFYENQKFKFEAKSIESMVSDQPTGLEETITGANNRAVNAFNSGDFTIGVGIESGIFIEPVSKKHINTTICSIYNGNKIFNGLGPGFMLPESISKHLTQDGIELDDAVKKAGYTSNKRIGYSKGLIGILSKDKIDRMSYTKPAVAMAVTAFINDL